MARDNGKRWVTRYEFCVERQSQQPRGLRNRQGMAVIEGQDSIQRAKWTKLILKGWTIQVWHN